MDNKNRVNRIIKPVTEDYLEKSLDLVQQVFTEYKNPEEGIAVRKLVEEIRSKKYYVPELGLMAVDDNGKIIGFQDSILKEDMKMIRWLYKE